eukprot:NODE_41_length_29768_cov_0.533924.p8 type:complete len:326 gc:universal NODE_41_length_29768_cov_0.533924:3909-2932(-)
MPILPDEIIDIILSFNSSSMFLINKKYTMKYLKPKYAHIYYQKNCIIPIFKHTTRRSVFAYEKWIIRFGVFLHRKYNHYELSRFKSLSNCKIFDIYVLNNMNENDDYSISLEFDFNCVYKILAALNDQFHSYKHILSEISHHCLSALSIYDLSVSFPNNIPTLTSLTVLYSNEFDLRNIHYPFIKQLKICEYESQNINDISHGFPHLNSLQISMNDILKCTILPKLLNQVEISFIHNEQHSLPWCFLSVPFVLVKVPCPSFNLDLFASGLNLKIKHYSFILGTHYCLSNYTLVQNGYQITKYARFNVYSKNKVDKELLLQLEHVQ